MRGCSARINCVADVATELSVAVTWQLFSELLLLVSGFCRGVNEIIALLGRYAE
jgi:hypothetical protein